MTRGALLERLQELQRTPKFQNRDICTISALLSKDALAKHVEHCEAAAGMSSRTAEQRSGHGGSEQTGFGVRVHS